MAPVRRYLRLTARTVLEVRVYLDDPADAGARWLLRARDPALPRVVAAARPLVLPKLREEHENARASRGKRKGIKDVVRGGAFGHPPPPFPFPGIASGSGGFGSRDARTRPAGGGCGRQRVRVAADG